jgi:hypothetical protein
MTHTTLHTHHTRAPGAHTHIAHASHTGPRTHTHITHISHTAPRTHTQITHASHTVPRSKTNCTHTTARGSSPASRICEREGGRRESGTGTGKRMGTATRTVTRTVIGRRREREGGRARENCQGQRGIHSGWLCAVAQGFGARGYRWLGLGFSLPFACPLQ